MNATSATAMDAIDIAEFLSTRRTGVLSLARDDEAYGLPMSYAYDHDSGDLFFRFGYAPGSEKRSFADETERASFSVYDHTDDGWKSVVARGRLEDLSAAGPDGSFDRLEATVVEAVRELDIPFFAVFDRPADDLSFSIVRLHVEQIDGVVEG